MPATPERPDIELTPNFKSRYELERQLGTGAMGAVYRARHRGTGRAVAIKFLLHAGSEQHLKRFERETQALVAIDHPNVLRIFDHGEVSGHPFLVTEVLEGGTLRHRIKKKQAGDYDLGLAIARQVLSGLAACHARGILHRDLKPENVLFDGEGTAKLADLGLAKRLDDDPEAQLTKAGEPLGTPLYMAPEQLAGKPLTPAADLYSVALMILELWTGRVPLKGSTIFELIAKRKFAPPEIDAKNVPGPVRKVMLAMLASDPAERTQSATEAAAALAEASSFAKADTVTLTPARRRKKSPAG